MPRASLARSQRLSKKLERDRKLQRKDLSRPGRPPIAVYNPDDVKRIAEERSRAAEPGILPPETSALAPIPRTAPTGFLEALVNASNFLRCVPQSALFLKLPEASDY